MEPSGEAGNGRRAGVQGLVQIEEHGFKLHGRRRYTDNPTAANQYRPRAS